MYMYMYMYMYMCVYIYIYIYTCTYIYIYMYIYIYIYISTYAASARLQRAWPDLAGAQRSASRPIVTHTQRVNIWVKNTHIQSRTYITLHYTTSHHIITSHDMYVRM